MSKGANAQVIIERYLGGDLDAINELVPFMDGMIKSIIKKHGKGWEFEELYQVAWVALMRCLKSYDINKGVLFTSFSYTAIERDIMQYKKKASKHRSQYDKEGNCTRILVSLDGHIANNSSKKMGGDCVGITLGDIIVDDKVDIEAQIVEKELKPLVIAYANMIDNSNQQFIVMNYLAGAKQNWIAEQLQVSCGYVSRVISEFCSSCKKELNK